MTWQLKIDRSDRPERVCSFRLDGRIGTGASAHLTDTLVQAIDQGERRVLLDLSAVDYISSAGLVAFRTIADKLSALDGALVLCGVTEPVRLAFELGGLLSRLDIAASAAEGETKLAGASPR